MGYVMEVLALFIPFEGDTKAVPSFAGTQTLAQGSQLLG